MTVVRHGGAAVGTLFAGAVMALAGCGPVQPAAPSTAAPATAVVTTPAGPGPEKTQAPASGAVRTLWQGAPWGDFAFAGRLLLGVHWQASGDEVEAIGAATGAPAWTAAMPASLPDILGLVPAGNVVVVEAGHEVGHAPAMVYPVVSEYVALDLATGARLWAVPVAGDYQSPPIAVSGTFVLTGDPAQTVTALIAATGAVAWRDPRPADCPAWNMANPLTGSGLGLAADGALAAASFNCGSRVVVQRLDPATGKAVWTWRSPSVGADASQSLAVTAAAGDGDLLLLTGEVGSPPAGQEFASRLPRPYAWPVALGPDDEESTVLALDAATGQPRWTELGGQLETFALTAGAVCEVVNVGLECRDDSTGAHTMPVLLTGRNEGDSPPYVDDGYAGVSGGLAAVVMASSSGGVLLRVVRVRGGATVAQVHLAIGTHGGRGTNIQVFAVAAGPLGSDAILVLVRRVDLPGYPVLALEVPIPAAAR